MNEKLLKAMNQQICKEFESAYLYLDMAMEMEEAKFKGYASWLYKQYREEVSHAENFIRFLERRRERPVLSDIKAPALKAADPLEIARMVLEHEQGISASINELYDLADEVRDHATMIFLQSFISEQIEEEDNAQGVIDQFEFAGDSTAARYTVDTQLGQRT